MARGWNSETEPGLLPAGQFAVFTNLTLKSGAARPRPGDGVYTPEAGSVTAWKLGQLGVNAVFDVYDAGRGGAESTPFLVTIPAGGGAPRLREFATGKNEALAIAAPAAPVWGYLASTLGQNGLAQQETRTYAVAWLTGLGFASGLSAEVVTVTNDAVALSLSSHTGAIPVPGQVITNTTLGKTAKVNGVNPGFSQPNFVIRESEKSASGVWAVGNAVTWPGGSGVIGGGENPVRALPGFLTPANPPADAVGWWLYALDSDAGYWRLVSDPALAGGWPLGLTSPWFDITFFPFEDYAKVNELALYDGPLDTLGLPETLAGALNDASTAAVHRGCLFVAQGALIRYSEPYRPRWFRTWAVLNAGDTVVALIPRGQVVEVYTASGVLEIRGDSPTFELCDLAIRQGPTAPATVCPIEGSTLALYGDGVYAYAGGGLRNLTEGLHTGWVKALAHPERCVAGVRHGVYYLVAEDGDALCYDWRADEWFHRVFPVQPDGFLPVPQVGAAAKVGESYLVPEGGDGPVSWALEWPGGGDGVSCPTPSKVFLDQDGPGWIDLRVDGASAGRFPVTETPGFVRLPQARGGRWSIRLDGVGTAQNQAVREVRRG